MIFEVPRDELLQSISTVIGVVERKQSMPILSHLLIEATSSGVKIVGTDLEVEIDSSNASLETSNIIIKV